MHKTLLKTLAAVLVAGCSDAARPNSPPADASLLPGRVFVESGYSDPDQRAAFEDKVVELLKERGVTATAGHEHPGDRTKEAVLASKSEGLLLVRMTEFGPDRTVYSVHIIDAENWGGSFVASVPMVERDGADPGRLAASLAEAVVQRLDADKVLSRSATRR